MPPIVHVKDFSFSDSVMNYFAMALEMKAGAAFIKLLSTGVQSWSGFNWCVDLFRVVPYTYFIDIISSLVLSNESKVAYSQHS